VATAINEQLDGRPLVTICGEQEYCEAVQWTSKTIKTVMGWKNDYFIYDDPLEILLWSHVDGLDAEELVFAVESKFGVSLGTSSDVCSEYRLYGKLMDTIWEIKGNGVRRRRGDA
jgi:hypothetical protein